MSTTIMSTTAVCQQVQSSNKPSVLLLLIKRWTQLLSDTVWRKARFTLMRWGGFKAVGHWRTFGS